MKRENFELVKLVIHELDKAEKMLLEVDMMIAADGGTVAKCISMEFILAKQQLYIPIQYSETANRDIQRMKYELSQL